MSQSNLPTRPLIFFALLLAVGLGGFIWLEMDNRKNNLKYDTLDEYEHADMSVIYRTDSLKQTKRQAPSDSSTPTPVPTGETPAPPPPKPPTSQGAENP
jgi:hypothetical protein